MIDKCPLGPFSYSGSNKPTKYCYCRVFDVDLFSVFVVLAEVEDGFSDLHFYAHHDEHHLYSSPLEETLSIEHLEKSFNHIALSHKYHPLPKPLPVGDFFNFLL